MKLADAPAWLLRQGFRAHQMLWWTRAVTLGVRAIVLDGDSVLLVRHTYRPGWFLPGGGVERGASAAAAVLRALPEEGGPVVVSSQLTGLGLNTGEMTTIGKEVFAFARERAGDDKVEQVAHAIPGLGTLM